MFRQSFLWLSIVIAVLVPTLVSAIDCDKKTSTFQFLDSENLEATFSPGKWNPQNCRSRVFHAICETIQKSPGSEQVKKRQLVNLMTFIPKQLDEATIKRYCAKLPPSGTPTPEFDDDFDLGDL